MSNRYGARSNGTRFSEAMIQAVWAKGRKVSGQDAAEWRKDACGAWIHRDNYGDTTPNGPGWEIDHIVPISEGGTDALLNLQPLQWQNNRHKGDDFPEWSCLVFAK